MPATIRTAFSESNLIANPLNLPIPMTNGSVSVTDTFQGFPTGTLTYEGVPTWEISAFESAYDHKSPTMRLIRLTVNGILFIVDYYEVSAQRILVSDLGWLTVYTVTITLKSYVEYMLSVYGQVQVFNGLITYGTTSIGLNQLVGATKLTYSGPNASVTIPTNAANNYTVDVQGSIESYAKILGCYVTYLKGVFLTPLDSSPSWNLGREEITTDVTTFREYHAYNNIQLQWTQTPSTSSTVTGPNQPPYTMQEPVIQTTVETDANLTSPPDGSDVLKSMDSCTDNSGGPKKVSKTTTTVNGATQKEVTEIYDFVYLASDIYAGDGLLFSDDPAAYWKQVEHQETQYIYETIPDLALNITAQDPSNPNNYISLIIDPNSSQFVNYTSSGGSGSAYFLSNVQYLTKIITNGWRLFRFVKESNDNLISTDPDDPQYPYCQFQTLNFQSETAYKLETSNTLYGTSSSSVPFTVQWMQYSQLSTELQEEVDVYSQVTQNGLVGILYPDPNYVTPMSVLVETKMESSFAWTPQPDTSADNIQPPYMTGREAFYSTVRTFIDTNTYSEKITEFSTDNSGFSDVGEKISFRTVSGKMPEAQTMKQDWQKVNYANNAQTYGNTPANTLYYLTSDGSKLVASGGTLQYTQATSQAQAQEAALTDLIINGMQDDQRQCTVFSFYPTMKSGDVLTTAVDRYDNIGKWHCMTINWTLKYSGTNNLIASPFCTLESFNVTTGLARNRQLSTSTAQSNGSTTVQNSSTDPQLTVTGGQASVIGTVLINAPNRRQF